MIYREDMKMFWSGSGRLVNCLIDYYRLYTKIIRSNNFSIEY